MQCARELLSSFGREILSSFGGGGGSPSFISGGFFLVMAKDSSGLVVGPPLELSWADSSLEGCAAWLMTCCNVSWLLSSFGLGLLCSCGRGQLCSCGGLNIL